MPVIFDKNGEITWLDANASEATVFALLRPFGAELTEIKGAPKHRERTKEMINQRKMSHRGKIKPPQFLKGLSKEKGLTIYHFDPNKKT